MRRTNFFFKLFNIVFSLIALNLSYFVAYVLRFETFDGHIFYSFDYDILLVFLNLVLIINGLRDQVFTNFESVSSKKILISIIKDLLVVILSMFPFIVALKGYQYSRQFHIYFSLLFLVNLYIFKYLNFVLIYFYNIKTLKDKNIAILSLKKNLPLILNRLNEKSNIKFNLYGLYAFDSQENDIIGNYAIKPIDDIVNDDTKYNLELIIFFHDTYVQDIKRIIELAENQGIRVRMVPNFISLGKTDLVLEYEYNLPLLRVRPEPLENVNNYLYKKLFDLFFAGIFMIVIFPIMYLIIGLLIKLSSRGPVFFKQLRTGQLNHEFYCYKFRTMKMNPESDSKQASKNDPRFTWIGKILRKTNLDEFPQFINVLKGDMSLVGPRPHMLKHTEEYSEIIEFYKVRHFCKPGITGWAQVNGFRGETENPELMKKRVEYDIWYIENWSFTLDIKILFLTIWAMLKGQEQAY